MAIAFGVGVAVITLLSAWAMSRWLHFGQHASDVYRTGLTLYCRQGASAMFWRAVCVVIARRLWVKWYIGLGHRSWYLDYIWSQVPPSVEIGWGEGSVWPEDLAWMWPNTYTLESRLFWRVTRPSWNDAWFCWDSDGANRGWFFLEDDWLWIPYSMMPGRVRGSSDIERLQRWLAEFEQWMRTGGCNDA